MVSVFVQGCVNICMCVCVCVFLYPSMRKRLKRLCQLSWNVAENHEDEVRGNQWGCCSGFVFVESKAGTSVEGTAGTTTQQLGGITR